MDRATDAGEDVSADDLWWAWAVLATRTDLPRDVRVHLDETEQVLALDQGAGWLRMQRLQGGRALLWGRTSGSTVRPLHHEPEDVVAGVPDWASSDAVRRSSAAEDPEFLAWYARGEWDTSTTDRWDDSLHLFDLFRRVSVAEVRAAREGRTDHPLLTAARRAAPLADQDTIRRRIATQVHRQMADADERDRNLPDRPMLLTQWLRIVQPHYAFTHVVRVVEGVVEPVATVPRLAAAAARRLDAVLQQVYRHETADDSGGWLLGRVKYDGARIRLDRAFDSLPPWFRAEPPSLDALTWEMRQRTRRWRPAWTGLLPERLD